MEETKNSEEAQEIVDRWRKRSKNVQNLHYDSAAKLMRWHYRTGAPLVILSVIVGSKALLAFTELLQLESFADLIIGVIALLVAILAALQAFMSYEARASLHYIAGTKYGAIKRQLEAIICEGFEGQSAAGHLKKLGPEWDALTEESPPIPLSAWKAAERKKKAAEE